MSKQVSLWQFLGFAFTSIAGTLLHFLYDWTNQSLIVAPFSAVNESTWEHMKLIFFPMFVYALAENLIYGREYKNFWCVKLKGIAVGVIMIPVLFYTYNGIFGRSPDWINIAIFFIAAAVSYIIETGIFREGSKECAFSALAFVLLCIIALSFGIFTFVTPRIPIFEDPITKLYGLPA